MPQRILIAEDDELQGAALRSALERRGYEVEIVGDGLEAVSRLRTGRYDLALLDYQLPAVDGLVAARLLQDLLHKEDRPRLIALTAAVDGLREREATLGVPTFDTVVSKRDGLPALLTVVEAHLSDAAEAKAATIVQNGRKVLREAADRAAVERRWRLLSQLEALPGLATATLSIIALGWVAGSPESLRDNAWFMFIVLTLSALHGVWTVGVALWRRSHQGAATTGSSAAETWHRPMPPPLAKPQVHSPSVDAEAVSVS